MLYRGTLLLTCVLLGCDGGASKATRPEPTPAPSAAGKPAEPAANASTPAKTPGFLDPELVRAATSAQEVEKFKLKANADGTLRYLAVYHHDASAIPASVTGLVEKQFPGSKIVRYESESIADVGHVFEVEVETGDKQRCELNAKPDGAILYTECAIDPKALPEPVRAAFERTFPGATIKEAEKKTMPGSGEEFELEFEVGGKEHELYLQSDGKLLRHELVLPAQLQVSLPLP